MITGKPQQRDFPVTHEHIYLIIKKIKLKMNSYSKVHRSIIQGMIFDVTNIHYTNIISKIRFNDA